MKLQYLALLTTLLLSFSVSTQEVKKAQAKAVSVPAVPAAKKVVPAAAAQALPAKKLKVVTTLSVLRALTKEVGGDLVEVSSLSTATEDPHFVKAKPTFKRLVSEADLFIENGRNLELWVPQVIGASSNPKLVGAGLVSASSGIRALEVPSALTRAQGDIHPQGNPHVWLSPIAALKMADNIKAALIAKDAAHKAIYEKNFAAFKAKLADAFFGHELVKATGSIDFLLRMHEGKNLAAYLANKKKTAGGFVKLAQSIDYSFITYHTVWSYLADEFGLKVFGQIEEKSGIPPSLKYQNDLVKRAKENGVTHVVAASYYVGYGKLIELLAKQIGGQKVFIDVDCRDNESYIDMMSRILKTLADFKTPPAAVKTK